MIASTTLTFAPKSSRLADLRAFQARIAHYLDHARQHQGDNPFYGKMVPILEVELIAVTQRIVQRQRRAARLAASDQVAAR